MTRPAFRHLMRVFVVLVCGLSGVLAQSAPSATSFALKDGDRVLFYGDSITAQREYTKDVEEYVLTRFPRWKVIFLNAGEGGDTVGGGLGAGPIGLRLQRDVFQQHPDVITIMLGMNDGFSRAEEPGIFSTYADGLRRIVESMQTTLPHARITLIQPSPHDDTTREPRFPGGYNGVMLQYGAFVAELSRERGTQLADFNSPVTDILKTLKQQAPDLAKQVLPDRVHPAPGGHWVLAESLLKAWHASSLVSSVAVDVSGKVPSTKSENARVTEFRLVKGKLSWTQIDDALPLPLPPVEVDPVVALVVKYSDLVQSLDQQILQVRGLSNGSYDLLIDGRNVGTFPGQQLANGINLATLDTPMLEQARLVAYDSDRKNLLEDARFELIHVSAENEASNTAHALAAAILTAQGRQRTDAQPRPHQFQLVAAPTGGNP